MTQPEVTPVSLGSIQEQIGPELDRVFDELGRIVRADFPMIADVNRHLLKIRGKMFRPTLLLLTAKAANHLSPRSVTLSAVVELIHLATLIHDDSVDHSALRRGQPTVNSLFSHQTAVIMGDYLYSRAIVELVELADIDALRVMSRVTNEMTVGEMREIEAHDELDYSIDAYDRMIDAKTASLLSATCEVGVIGADPALREPMRRFGRALGMAFQIADDVLDYTSSEDVTGKPVGLDLREHKLTLPLLAALPQMNAAERAQVTALMADPEPSSESIAEVVGIVERRGGIERAQTRAQEFALRAEDELAVLPDGPAREALRDCVVYVVQRRM